MNEHKKARDQDFIKFITWKDDFATMVELINHQHRNVLDFLNQWYNEVRGGLKVEDPAGLMSRKFEYLNRFSLGHLRFESGMLKLLRDHYGFSDQEYQEHMRSHSRFVKELMIPLSREVKLLGQSDTERALQNISKDSLRDVGKWWYQHIKAPEPGEEPGPDHRYRLYIDSLSSEQRLALLNDIIMLQDQSRQEEDPSPAE